MAYGEINVSGDDVLEALTYINHLSYTRVLNSDGEILADLIVERVMQKLAEKLKGEKGDE